MYRRFFPSPSRSIAFLLKACAEQSKKDMYGRTAGHVLSHKSGITKTHTSRLQSLRRKLAVSNPNGLSLQAKLIFQTKMHKLSIYIPLLVVILNLWKPSTFSSQSPGMFRAPMLAPSQLAWRPFLGGSTLHDVCFHLEENFDSLGEQLQARTTFEMQGRLQPVGSSLEGSVIIEQGNSER